MADRLIYLKTVSETRAKLTFGTQRSSRQSEGEACTGIFSFRQMGRNWRSVGRRIGLALAKSVGAKVSLIFVVEPILSAGVLNSRRYELRKGTGHERVGSRDKCGEGGRCFLRDD